MWIFHRWCKSSLVLFLNVSNNRLLQNMSAGVWEEPACCLWSKDQANLWNLWNELSRKLLNCSFASEIILPIKMFILIIEASWCHEGMIILLRSLCYNCAMFKKDGSSNQPLNLASSFIPYPHVQYITRTCCFRLPHASWIHIFHSNCCCQHKTSFLNYWNNLISSLSKVLYHSTLFPTQQSKCLFLKYRSDHITILP